MSFTTNTDSVRGDGWLGVDRPLRLREWGTDRAWELPTSEAAPPALRIGTREGSWLRLDDPRVSKDHAKLERFDERWVVSDLNSKNGLWQDGERRISFPLGPGIEIGVGGVTLIVESARLIELHALLARLIGWSAARRGDVDRALRVVRMTATRRGSLLLVGEGDLVAVAQMLHRHALGEDRPFIVCDPRRRQTDPNARVAANYATGLAALEAAAGGTLCVRKDRKPPDFATVLVAIREPSSRAQLVICAQEIDPSDPVLVSPIVLPPLAGRADELERVIDAFGGEAASRFGGAFTPADRAWIRDAEAGTIAQIERATARLVALRAAEGKVTIAAKMLEMAHGSLSEWLARRPLPA